MDSDKKIYERDMWDELYDLFDYCFSDELTLPTLQDKLKNLFDRYPLHLHEIKKNYKHTPLLHSVCFSKGVTMDIVKYILEIFPNSAGVLSEEYCYAEPKFIHTKNAYPLHLACLNQHCSTAIIELLMEKYPAAIKHFTWAGDTDVLACGGGDDGMPDEVEGVPLHYYVMRETNIRIETMKMLIDAYPQALLATDSELRYTPVHAILGKHDEYINNRQHALKFLLEEEPLQIQVRTSAAEKTPLHIACSSRYITLEMLQFIYNLWPEAGRIPTWDDFESFPIHELCINEHLDAETSLDILNFMLGEDPSLVRLRGNMCDFPIHNAVGRKAFDFCKVLIDEYPESLRNNEDGSLPIHSACSWGFYGNQPHRADIIDTIQYMLGLYPESINVPDGRGWSPMHMAAQVKRADIVELLLKHDPCAASSTSENDSSQLPLHSACENAHNIEVLQALFDAYPQAILTRNGEGKTPLEMAQTPSRWHRRERNQLVVNFLQTQQAYVQQAQDIKRKTNVDENDWQSLCSALKDNAPFGSIKLLVEALRSIGHTNSLPLNTACEFSSGKVVRHLVELDSVPVEQLVSLQLLHNACHGGNLGVIKYFLDDHTSLVASAEANEKGELPIHLLCEAGKDTLDYDSVEYIDIIWRMLLANPEAVVGVAKCMENEVKGRRRWYNVLGKFSTRRKIFKRTNTAAARKR